MALLIKTSETNTEKPLAQQKIQLQIIQIQD